MVPFLVEVFASGKRVESGILEMKVDVEMPYSVRGEQSISTFESFSIIYRRDGARSDNRIYQTEQSEKEQGDNLRRKTYGHLHDCGLGGIEPGRSG